MTRAARLAVAVAGLLLAGCSSASGGNGGPAAGLTQPPIADPTAPPTGRDGMTRLPLSAYGSDDQLVNRRAQAITLLSVQCLRKRGYTVDPQALFGDSPPAGSDNDTALPGGAWGYIGADVAAGQGFHGRQVKGPNPGPPQAQPQSDAERAATADCTRTSVQQFNTPETPAGRLYTDLYSASLTAATKDRRVVAATASWRDCMGKSGLQVTDPQTLVAQYQHSPATTPDEFVAAKADVACTMQTNLAGIYFAVLSGYQQEQVQQHGEELASLKQAAHDQDEKIAKVLSSNGS